MNYFSYCNKNEAIEKFVYYDPKSYKLENKLCELYLKTKFFILSLSNLEYNTYYLTMKVFFLHYLLGAYGKHQQTFEECYKELTKKGRKPKRRIRMN